MSIRSMMERLRGWRMARQFKSAGGLAMYQDLPTSERRKFMEDDMFEYLDELHSVALLNFHNAGANLQEEFGLSKKEATAVLRCWMSS